VVKHFLHRVWCYVAALLILSGVIAIHEGGHWIAAELNGAHCRTFNIGFGPGIRVGQVSQTEIWICCLPFGGYVELPMSEPFGNDGIAIANISTMQKLFVFGAGIGVNILCGVGLLYYLGRMTRTIPLKDAVYELALQQALMRAKRESKFSIESAKIFGDRAHRFLRGTLNFLAACGNPLIGLSEGPMNGWKGIVKEAGVFSIFLGIANLVPIAPLDGARMVDALFYGGVLSGGRPAETMSTPELVAILAGVSFLVVPVIMGLLPALVYMYRFEVSFFKNLSILQAKSPQIIDDFLVGVSEVK
jgi:hypothetical protein